MSPEDLAKQLNITVEQLLFCRKTAVTSCDRLFPLPLNEHDSQTVWMVGFILHTCLNHLPVEPLADCYRILEDDYPLLTSLKDARIPVPPCLNDADLQVLAYQILVAKSKCNPVSEPATEPATEPAIAA